MKKTLFTFAITIIGLLILTACGSKYSPIVGTWERQAGSAAWVYEFSTDGTVVVSVG